MFHVSAVNFREAVVGQPPSLLKTSLWISSQTSFSCMCHCVMDPVIQESCECSRNMFTAPFVVPGCTGPSFAKEHNCMLCTSCFMFQCHKLHIHLEFEKAVKATLNIPLLSYCLLFFTILLALVLQPLAPSGIHWFKLEPVGMWWSEFSFGHRNLKHRGGKHKVADEGANNVVTKQ